MKIAGERIGTKRLPYWTKRYEEQGERTVGHRSFDANKFKLKSLEAGKLLSEFLLEYDIIGSERILDYGCGHGRLSAILAPRFFAKVYGIDIVPWAIEKAKEACPIGIFQVFDGLTIPFPDFFFDAALSWTVLQHIPPDEIERACNELGRVICPGGDLILYENTSTWLEDADHIWFRPPGQYRDLFPGFNFAAMKVIPKADDTPEEHSLILLERLPSDDL